MTTRRIRVYHAYASTSKHANIKVFYTLPGHGYNKRLYTCLICGAFYVLDMDNPSLKGTSVDELLMRFSCDKCHSKFENGDICEYPETFMYNGEMGHFSPDKIIPPDESSSIIEVNEIEI